MTHLTSEDIYGEYYLDHLGDVYKNAARLITHVREQRRLGQEVDADTIRAYDKAKQTTKFGDFQRKNTRQINDFITKKLEERDEGTDTSFVSALDSDSEGSGSESGSEDTLEDQHPEQPLPDDDGDGHESDDSDDPSMPHHADHVAGGANPCDYPTAPDEVGNEPRGNEIGLIPEFKGDGHADAEIWIRRVETVASTYGWKRTRWQQTAATKLSSFALKWLEAKSRTFEFPYRHQFKVEEGKCHGKPIANADPPANHNEPEIPLIDSWLAFKDAFFLRFKAITDASAAVRAVQDLKQGADESVHAFFDRVSIAVDRKNYLVDDKTTVEYKTTRDSDQYSFFAAGLRQDIKKLALGGPRPATDVRVFLGDCINAELVLGTNRSVQEVQVDEVKQEASGTPDDASASLTVAELKKEIDALRSNMKCFKCGETGHLRRQCKNASKDSPAGGNGNNNNISRSNNNRRRGGGRGNQGNRQGGNNQGNRQGGGGRRQGGGGQNQGGPQNQGYQKGNWNRAQRGWVPQANFGQPGNYYQNHMINQHNPYMPFPYGPAMSTSSGGSQNSSSISAEPWVLAGNE